MNLRTILFAAPALLLFVNCGGNDHNSPQAATTLVYTNPTPASGEWALMKDNSASTSTRLVLNLVGPTGSLFRGVGFNLKADGSKVAFSQFQDAKGTVLGYMLDKGVLHDLDSTSQAMPCLASAAGTKGDVLSVGLYQKCLRVTILPEDQGGTVPIGSQVMNTAMDCSTTPVLQVALSLAKGALPGGASLAVLKANMIPGSAPSDLPTRTTVKVGTLTLK